MTILEKLKEDLNIAIKIGDTEKRDNIRLVVSECQRIGKSLDDDQVIKVVRKLVKSEEQVMEINKGDGGSYYRLIKGMLPQEASDDEIKSWIDSNVDFSKLKAKAQAIGLVMKEFGANTNGKKVKQILESY